MKPFQAQKKTWGLPRARDLVSQGLIKARLLGLVVHFVQVKGPVPGNSKSNSTR